MKRILCMALLIAASSAMAASVPADSTAAPADPGRITFYGLGYRDTPDFQIAGLTTDFGPVAFADREWLDLELCAPSRSTATRGRTSSASPPIC